ncbi:DUF4434 domain-containing protein [Arthrobacter sp. NPDC090010]|uniref:DUF4434 domain-containing protein n=1 Tax=Arthrobacter sp. NPDC090010 TaxID=3363942 RepID=UPI00381F3DE0
MRKVTAAVGVAVMALAIALPWWAPQHASAAQLPGSMSADVQTVPGPALGSTFLDSNAAKDWSDERWDRSFTQMESVGIRSVIVEVAIDDKQQFSYYPTGLVGYPSKDVIGHALDEAQAHGMRVWLGLRIDRDAWYSGLSFDPAWLSGLASQEVQAATDLTAHFADRMNIVDGWYFAGEDTPWGVGNDGGLARQQFYRELGTGLDAVTPGKRIMISPYYHATPGNKTSSEFRDYLATALNGTSIDVVALQTCADMACYPPDPTDQARRATVISDWAQATRAGVLASGSGAEVWANVELFSTGVTPFATVDDVVATMRAAQPFVSGFTSWSFGNQWATDASYGTDWWLNAYSQYVQTGLVPSTAPAPPSNTTGTVSGTQLTVSWTTPPGQQIAYLELLRRGTDGYHKVADGLWNDVSSVTIDGYQAGAEYLLRTRNAAGIRSAPVVVPVGSPVTAEQWSAHAMYQASEQASPAYPDAGGELTDGAMGGGDFTAAPWQGHQNQPSQQYTVDLGSQRPIRTVDLGTLAAPEAGIVHPDEVTVESSPDGISWVPFATASPPTSSTGRGVWSAQGLASARYIRVHVAAHAEWTFLDEVSVRG